MQEFNFSMSAFNKRMAVGLIMLFVIMLAPPTIFVMSGRIEITQVLEVLPFLLLMVLAIVIITGIPIITVLRKTKVIVYDDKIVKPAGKKEQFLLWSDITKVELAENPKGSVIFITLYRNLKKELYLGGFNDMDKLAQLIKEKVPNTVSVQVKRYKIDWTSPKTLLVSGALAILTATVIFFMGKIGEKGSEIFSSLFYLIWGVSQLICRPLAKTNLRLKWVDIIIGILLIIAGILRFI